MDFEKFLKMDNKKKAIALAVVVAIIIIILLLLRSCGGKKGDDGNLGGDANASLTTSVAGDVNGGDSGVVLPDPADITYDEELICTWYKDEVAMVLAEEGYGDLYYGDSEGDAIQWYTSGNNLYLTTDEGTSVTTYVVNGDDLILTYKDGKTETWFR